MASFLGSIWPLRSRSDESLGNSHDGHTSPQNGAAAADGSMEEQSTPKAAGNRRTINDVPTFSLLEPEQTDKSTNNTLTLPTAVAAIPARPLPSQQSGEDSDAKHGSGGNIAHADPELRPTSSSKLRASLMPPPARSIHDPRSQQKSTSNSLSVPVRPGGSLIPPMSVAPLRVPSNGPLPNRGFPDNSQQRVGSNARGKVLLAPGHSPMDWAALTRTNNLSGVTGLQRVTPSQMKVMNGRKGKPIWSSYQGKVYNITPYLPFHPGGEKELMKAAGRDGTKLFMDIHPWVAWESMLSSCLVGILVSEGADEGLDAID